jgi:hypothetical protein
LRCDAVASYLQSHGAKLDVFDAAFLGDTRALDAGVAEALSASGGKVSQQSVLDLTDPHTDFAGAGLLFHAACGKQWRMVEQYASHRLCPTSVGMYVGDSSDASCIGCMWQLAFLWGFGGEGWQAISRRGGGLGARNRNVMPPFTFAQSYELLPYSLPLGFVAVAGAC